MNKFGEGIVKKVMSVACMLLILYFSVVVIRQLAIVPRLFMALNSKFIEQYESLMAMSSWMEECVNWSFSLLAAYLMYLFWKRSATGKGVLIKSSHFKLKLVLTIIVLIPFTVYFADIFLAWVRPLTVLFYFPSKWIFDTVTDSGSMMFLRPLKEVSMPWSFTSVYGEIFNYRIVPFTHLIPFYMLRIYCFSWAFKSMYNFKILLMPTMLLQRISDNC